MPAAAEGKILGLGPRKPTGEMQGRCPGCLVQVHLYQVIELVLSLDPQDGGILLEWPDDPTNSGMVGRYDCAPLRILLPGQLPLWPH